MRTSFRNVMIATTAMISLGAFAASAAAPAPGDSSGATIQASAPAPGDSSGTVVKAAAPAPGDSSGATIQASAPKPGDSGSATIQAAAVDHDITGKVEQRITDLHAALKITTAQEPQWAALAGIMRDNAKAMDQSFQHRVTGMAGMNAADNMQSYADMATLHAQGMQKMTPAFRSLYTVLTAEQKTVADQEFVDNAHHGADKPKG